MGKTLTVRLDLTQDKALAARAKLLGQTRSAVVRDLIDQGLEARPLGRRIGHLKGKVELPSPNAGWRRDIKDRNWR